MSKKSYPHIIACYLILMLLAYQNTYCQQFNNWIFPQNLGLTFNTSPPSILTNTNIGITNSVATISDKFGNLLFYTNGTTVFNRNHLPMPNGTGLNGLGLYGINSALIAPTNDSNRYYIFTANGSTFSGLQGYRYSLVDISLNNGLGDVIIKNELIYTPSTTCRFNLIPHSNGLDFWLICKLNMNEFRCYKFSCNGINGNPVISNVGTNISLFNDYRGGDLKISPDKKTIAISYFYGNYIELFNFNNDNGTVFNSIKIPKQAPFGIEFSGDSKILYITSDTLSSSGSNIYQYNLLNYDSISIKQSETLIGSNLNRPRGSLQLAADGKIYHCPGNSNYLDVIHNPNNIGINCNFQNNAIALNSISDRTYAVLPKGFTNLFYNQSAQITNYTINAPCNTVTLFAKTYIKGNHLSFHWNFGDGTTLTQTVPSGGDTTFTSVTHNFPALQQDSFYVTLTVTSDTLCGQSSTGKPVILRGIIFPTKPKAGFTYQTFCNGSVQFTDTAQTNGNTLSYKWYFGNGDSSTLASPIYQFNNTSPNYTVTQIVQGCLADTFSTTITPTFTPTAALTYTNNCGSLTANFNFTTNATIAKRYIWWGNGFVDSISTAANFSYTYTAYDTFLLKMLVKDVNGCFSDTFYLPVITKAKPIAAFVYNNNACANTAFVLNNTSTVTNSVLTNFIWQANGIVYANTANASFSLPQGLYNFQLKVTSALGCTDSVQQTIAVQSKPTININFTNSCINKPIAFTGNATVANGSIVKYLWHFGNGDSALQQNVVYTYHNPGKYLLQCLATSSNGCIGVVTDSITIDSKPIANFILPNVCTGKLAIFNNTTTNFLGHVNYVWNFGNGLTSNQINGSTIYHNIGSYTVKLQATTTHGCIDTISKPITITNIPAFAGKDTTVWQGTPFTLYGSGGQFYQWQPANLLQNPTNAITTGIAQQTQQFILKVTNTDGCIGYDSVWVYVMLPLKIPNAFSPNGDGINDTWAIGNANTYNNLKVQVFNRAGQLVHEQQGSFTPWNGTYNNKPLPLGTYYYIIQTHNNMPPKTGWVMIIK
jgi:gliding motility-associated-like protein